MRTCMTCKQRMVEGYLLEEACQTFCSDVCLDAEYPGSSVEMANMTDEQLEESACYWTDWVEDNDLERISYDEAKERFLADKKVYQIHEDETETLITNVMQLIGHEGEYGYEDNESYSLQSVSFETAKASFLDDVPVYLKVWGAEQRRATHLDDLIDHEAIEGEFVVPFPILKSDDQEKEFTGDNIICPHCRHENNEEKSELLFENEIYCEGCGKQFMYTMAITYTSCKL